MNTADSLISSGNIILSPQQAETVGRFPIFIFPGLKMPTIEYPGKKTEQSEIDDGIFIDDINILELGKKYFEENKKFLLRKYKGKYIAILNNKVVGTDKNFSKLAERIYKKFGYQTIYMPFVTEKENIVKIPSPRII